MNQIPTLLLGALFCIGFALIWVRLNSIDLSLRDLRSINQHFIDRFMNHEGRISTVEERTKPKEGK